MDTRTAFTIESHPKVRVLMVFFPKEEKEVSGESLIYLGETKTFPGWTFTEIIRLACQPCVVT